MRIALLALMMCSFNGSVIAATNYEVSVQIKDNHTTLVFPMLLLSSEAMSGQSHVNGCSYFGKLTEQKDLTLLLEGKVVCIDGARESRYDTPIFILRSDGGKASMGLGEEGALWEYFVEINRLSGD